MTAAPPVLLPPEAVRCIRANPDDDAPRLIWADWIAESGNPDRGEFIRLDIQLFRLREKAGAYFVSPNYAEGREIIACEMARDKLAYRWRDLRPEVVGLPDGWQGLLDAKPALNPRRPYGPGDRLLFFGRGYADGAVCSAAEWLAHGDRLTAEHPPLTVVTLTTWPKVYGRREMGGLYTPTVEPTEYLFTHPDEPIALAALADRWPGVAFALPAGPQIPLPLPAHPAGTLNPDFHLERGEIRACIADFGHLVTAAVGVESVSVEGGEDGPVLYDIRLNQAARTVEFTASVPAGCRPGSHDYTVRLATGAVPLTYRGRIVVH